MRYASWEIDGRKGIRNTEGDVIATRALTRRIRLHWPGYNYQDSYIVLVAPESWGSRGLFFGRAPGLAKDSHAVAKEWMDLCHKSHGARCSVKRGVNFENMRRKAFFGVIDVDMMCLTSLPPDERYVALSYTWASEQPFKSTSQNFRTYREKGGIQANLKNMPRVIRDAIGLVRQLGERFLWVDALCIIQDSDNLNTRLMDVVYGAAHLTICAADEASAATTANGSHGLNAAENMSVADGESQIEADGPVSFKVGEASLKAFDPSERTFDQHVHEYDPGYAPSIQLMVSYLAETFVKRSRWDTRAWTFQERMLSRRCLIFVDGRMYFQCYTTTMCENIVSEDSGMLLRSSYRSTFLIRIKSMVAPTSPRYERLISSGS